MNHDISQITHNITLESINPEIAQTMLDAIPAYMKNARINTKLRDSFAKYMQDGTWREDIDSSPLRFNVKGELLDRKHRLSAIIASGATITMPVLRHALPKPFVMKKTPRMLSVEHELNDTPLEQIVPDMIRSLGINATASKLRISRSALYIWVAKLGLEVNHKATVTTRQEGIRP